MCFFPASKLCSEIFCHFLFCLLAISHVAVTNGLANQWNIFIFLIYSEPEVFWGPEAYSETWYIQIQGHILNPGRLRTRDIFRTLVYSEPEVYLELWYIRNQRFFSEPWYIQNQRHTQSPGIFSTRSRFRTLVYSEPWYIKNQRHIQNLGIFRTRGIILKVVSATFLLVSFLRLKESTCETRKNVFYFTSKALFVLEIIKI